MVATLTASYFLLTADYGPGPNALDPIKNAIFSAQSSVKDFIIGPKREVQESEAKNLAPSAAEKHP
ncbi:OLC1v1023130C2 [Oldenlandia corymbosa var. corymbosa]|nr:OLC1v1023130C2 [Oldenlandia corymbosa var. corymbosa]